METQEEFVERKYGWMIRGMKYHEEISKKINKDLELALNILLVVDNHIMKGRSMTFEEIRKEMIES